MPARKPSLRTIASATILGLIYVVLTIASIVACGPTSHAAPSADSMVNEEELATCAPVPGSEIFR